MFRRVAAGRSFAWTWWPRRRAMARCQRRIVSGAASSRSPWRRTFRYHACQGREQRAVRPRQLRAGRRLALQDHKLLAQDHDLGGLLRLLTPGQPQPRGDPSDQEEDQPAST
jgi:hypothetical protein